MATFAVVKTGGKQYLVHAGDVIKIEKLTVEPGVSVELETLLVAEDGGAMEIGSPTLGKRVKAEVLRQGRAKKIDVIKFKRKVRYKRKYGHRQPFTEVKIAAIA